MVKPIDRGDSVKRRFIVLAAFLLLTGCSGSKSTQPVTAPQPAPPVTQTEPGAPEPPKVVEPTPTDGPLYLLAAPPNPVWAGPVTVVVENSPQSRPQVGLQEADMVVEMLAESEISRFLAFYWSNPVEKIGPVRSARVGTVAIADAYNAPFVHAGSSNEALAILQTQWGAKNLDEIYTAGPYFVRSDDRLPPHNLYTSTDLLDQAITGRKIEMEAVPATAHAKERPAPGQQATRVEIDWHRLHKVQWELKGDRYLRQEDGQPHLQESGEQLGAANLVFLKIQGVNRGPDLGWSLDFPSGGTATVLVAGHKWEGTWALEEGGGFVLTPAGGKGLLLAPGNTWVHLITQESDFSLQ